MLWAQELLLEEVLDKRGDQLHPQFYVTIGLLEGVSRDLSGPLVQHLLLLYKHKAQWTN